MNWQPASGTEAISSWINQVVLFALVLAVAAVVGWAVGSLSANGAVVSRARVGVVVSLAAALLPGRRTPLCQGPVVQDDAVGSVRERTPAGFRGSQCSAPNVGGSILPGLCLTDLGCVGHNAM